MATLKQMFRDLARKEAGEWLELQPAWLGDFSGTVQASSPGMVYARLINGKVVEAYNTLAPMRFDVPVKIGRSRTLPNVWQVIEVREFWDTPAGAGEVAYHARQHMFGAGDMIPIDRKQVLAMTAMVSNPAGFGVTVYGGVFQSATGIALVANQDVDLSSYATATAGARYVSIEADDDGALSVHEGADFEAPELADVSDIPVPETGKYMVAYALLYVGQTELSDDNLRVPMPLGFNVSDFLTTVSWGEIGGTLADQTDLLAALAAIALDELSDVDAAAPTDGQVLTWNDVDGEWQAVDPTGGGGSGVIDAEYVTSASHTGLSDEVVIPGLAGSPDITGAGGAGTSEEYDTTTTGITFDNAVTTVNADTAAKSHLYIKLTGDTNIHRGTKAWSPAGAFDVRAKISIGGTNTNTQSLGLLINDNASADGNGVLVWFTIAPATPGFALAAYTYASGTPTQRGSTWTVRTNLQYLRITRDGSNNVSFYFSADGLAWQKIATQSFTFTPSRLGFRLQLANSADVIEAYIDFLRTSV